MKTKLFKPLGRSVCPFTISISDGFCEYEYPAMLGNICIDEVAKKIIKALKATPVQGKFAHPTRRAVKQCNTPADTES